MPKGPKSATDLRLRASQLEAQLKDVENLAKTAERKEDAHRKIVLGSFYASRYSPKPGSPWDISRLPADELARLSAFVKRPHDRKVIGLPHLAATSGP
jgi:hypothetical protein